MSRSCFVENWLLFFSNFLNCLDLSLQTKRGLNLIRPFGAHINLKSFFMVNIKYVVWLVCPLSISFSFRYGQYLSIYEHEKILSPYFFTNRDWHRPYQMVNPMKCTFPFTKLIFIDISSNNYEFKK